MASYIPGVYHEHIPVTAPGDRKKKSVDNQDEGLIYNVKCARGIYNAGLGHFIDRVGEWRV